MKAPPTITTHSVFQTPLFSWRVWLTLGLFWSGMSSAAEPLASPDNVQTHTILSFSTSQFKSGLVWLRDFTVKSLTPMRGAFHKDEANWNDEVRMQFATKHELFKPQGEEAYRLMVERLLDQQMGLQVRDNVRLQWDVSQYRTANDQREVGLKLGVHYDFR